MRVRYRRKKLSRGDKTAAAAVSAAIGAGVAVVTFYFTRLLLSRDPLTTDARELTEGDGERALSGASGATDDEPAD